MEIYVPKRGTIAWRILSYLLENGPLTRKELILRTGANSNTLDEFLHSYGKNIEKRHPDTVRVFDGDATAYFVTEGYKKHIRKHPPEEEVSPAEAVPEVEMEVVYETLQTQLAALLLGNMFQHHTYTPDRGREFAGQCLGDASTYTSLDETNISGISDVEYIDVIWFRDDGWPAAAIEIEYSGNMKNDILKLSRLRGVDNIRLIVIGPEEKRKEFKRETNKRPYRNYKLLYSFISDRELFALIAKTESFLERAKQLGISWR